MVIKELTWVQVVWYYLIEVLILIRGPSFLLMRQRMIITNCVVYCVIFAYLLFINVELIEPFWLNSILRAFGTMKIIT
tara:strand:+ start:116 stop:349 length:234 start_codon:yes stop_codon:yes gene_type:complete